MKCKNIHNLQHRAHVRCQKCLWFDMSQAQINHREIWVEKYFTNCFTNMLILNVSICFGKNSKLKAKNFKLNIVK